MDYKSVIESKYNRANWQKLLHDIFGSYVKFWANPSEVQVNASIARKALNLGMVTLNDGNIIAIFEVELSDTVDIERNRRGIRDMLLSQWRGKGCAGAFMFCYRKDESVLRFSYVSESFRFDKDGNYKNDSTDPRRFTYLLGEGHRSRTAIQQFEKLRRSNRNLSDLTNAFSVEAVGDMFFAGYKKQYEDIVHYVTGRRMVKVANKWQEQMTGNPCRAILDGFAVFAEPEKYVRNYVKKLMGRLVFLQFLQKKGWMGVPVDKNWGEGDPEFVQSLFDRCDDKDHFVDNVLESLFNDLNTRRTDDVSSISSQFKVPYLNGGLFEREETDEVAFPLPARFMQSMLEFFSSYNFTIDENDPDDAEVGVDPEMLGRIFENLLEDNKDKGAFYTPKEIVDYMCRESLIAYLQTDIGDESTNDSIRQFVTSHDVALLGDNADLINQRLKDVKICDPAIGSGAFPMGLLRELFLCRSAIEGPGLCKASEIKKHIIQQNIYGVDIEGGAVDIARLRFWLALIVDEDTPQALPNLDFKIMQGNSLIESFEGFDLSRISGRLRGGQSKSNQLILGLDSEHSRKNLLRLLREYFSVADHQVKVEMRQAINNEVKTLIRESIGGSPASLAKLDKLDPSANQEFFLWHTWFKDIFDNGGFDIVIGNPPYIQLQADGGKLGELYKNCGFYTYARTGDIYSLFYEQGWNILAKGGYLCYITSNKWMRAGYGEKTREFFTTKTNPILLVDLGANVFENATVDTNILLFSKASNQKETMSVTFTEDGLDNLSDFVQQQSVECRFDSSDSWVILSPIEQSIKRKIESVGTPLKDWDIQINYGIKTGFNDAFIINTEKRNEILDNCCSDEERTKTAELIRPILRGRDIKRYGYDWANLWLINTHNGIKGVKPRIDINDYPAVKAHLDQYWDKVSKRADKGDTPYNLRNCAYLDDFYKPKIIFQEIVQESQFCFDGSNHFMCNDTCRIIVGNNLEFLMGIMNSKLFFFSIKTFFGGGGLGEHAIRMKHTFFSQFPCPTVNSKIEEKVRELILIGKTSLGKEIDNIVYELYGLSLEEVAFIERQ